MYGVITLFRMTTGEDWHRIMADLTIEGPYCVEDLTDYSMRDCGSPSWCVNGSQIGDESASRCLMNADLACSCLI